MIINRLTPYNNILYQNSRTRINNNTGLQDRLAHSYYEVPFRAASISLYAKKESCETIGEMLHRVISKNTFSVSEEDNLRQLLMKYLPTLKSKKRLLGFGFHESVYRINDEFAIKMGKNTKIEDVGNLELCKKEHSDLKSYFGGVLAKFGRIQILRNLGDHTPVGIPYGMSKDKATDYYRNEYLPLFANVPQESYNSLLADCATLNKRFNEGYDFYCHVFDYVNPNNIVLKYNKLFWVDKIRRDSSEKNSVSQVLNMMLNKYGIDNKDWISDGYGGSLVQARKIFNKIVIAGAENNLSFRTGSDMFSNKVLKNIFSNLRFNEDADNITKNIESIYRIENKSERILALKEYLSSL